MLYGQSKIPASMDDRIDMANATRSGHTFPAVILRDGIDQIFASSHIQTVKESRRMFSFSGH